LRRDFAQAIFVNPNGTLIVVHAGDGGGFLRVAVWNTESLERGDPREERVGDFATVTVQHPGFIEFDDVNNRIVVAYPEQTSYHVWHLLDYKLLFRVDGYKEMRVARGLGVFFSNPKQSKLHLHFFGMDDGRSLGSTEWQLTPRTGLVFIEQFHEYTLLKEQGHSVRVLDGYRKTVTEVPGTTDFNPQCFQYTTDIEHFFTVSEGQLDIWDVPGFQRKKIVGITALSQALLVNVSMQVVFACYREAPEPGVPKRPRVDAPNGWRVAAFRFSDGEEMGCVSIAGDAEVSSLAYDDLQHEFCTGMSSGVIYRWRAE
jgi:hypothetical protein